FYISFRITHIDFSSLQIKRTGNFKNSLCSNLKYRKTQTLPPYVQFFAIAQIEQRPPVGGGNFMAFALLYP
ncbi:hypothetical protein, partial [Escherichia coli]|uniref:hypothetical protein n=1 Tax=Escherichia coli TaxID=562 RepID=UPI001BD2D66F